MTGAILVGGRSRRMQGPDKTRLARGGERVLERLARMLGGVCSNLVCVGREEQAAEFEGLEGVEFLADLFPERGPMGGLYTALEETEDEVLAVACDLPYLEAPLIERLNREFQAIRPMPFALVVRVPAEAGAAEPWRIEPLCGIWSHHCRRPAYIALEAGDLSVTRFALQLHARFLDLTPQEAAALRNINAPEDLSADGDLAIS